MPEITGEQHIPADPRTNTAVKTAMRVGLLTSLVLLLVGCIVQLASGHDLATPVRMFAIGAAPSAGEEVMGVGILTLTLTPVSAVLTLVASWMLRERDRPFMGVGFVVLAVLTAAVVVGLAG